MRQRIQSIAHIIHIGPSFARISYYFQNKCMAAFMHSVTFPDGALVCRLSLKLSVSRARVPAEARADPHERHYSTKQQSGCVSAVKRLGGLDERQEEKAEHHKCILVFGSHVVGRLWGGKRNSNDDASGDLAAFPDFTKPTMGKVWLLIFKSLDEPLESKNATSASQ